MAIRTLLLKGIRLRREFNPRAMEFDFCASEFDPRALKFDP
jgi:hypothetical protein